MQLVNEPPPCLIPQRAWLAAHHPVPMALPKTGTRRSNPLHLPTPGGCTQLKDPFLRALQMRLTPQGPKTVQRTMSEELPLPRRTTVGEVATLLSPPQRSQPPQGHGVGPGPWYLAFCHPTEPLPASPSCIPACELVGEFKSLISAAEESDRVGASMNNDGSLGEAKQNLQFNHSKSLSLGYE